MVGLSGNWPGVAKSTMASAIHRDGAKTKKASAVVWKLSSGIAGPEVRSHGP